MHVPCTHIVRLLARERAAENLYLQLGAFSTFSIFTEGKQREIGLQQFGRRFALFLNLFSLADLVRSVCMCVCPRFILLLFGANFFRLQENFDLRCARPDSLDGRVECREAGFHIDSQFVCG